MKIRTTPVIQIINSDDTFEQDSTVIHILPTIQADDFIIVMQDDLNDDPNTNLHVRYITPAEFNKLTGTDIYEWLE